MDSNEIRAFMIAQRRSLSKRERTKADQVITKTIESLPQWKNASTVALYLSFGSEVGTKDLIDVALSSEKEVLLPVCQSHYNLLFGKYTRETPLVLTNLGLQEIAPDAFEAVSPDQIDFCLIPGLAFDPYGHRLGYGAGYYDRFLPTLSSSCAIVACAYQVQIYEKAPLPQKETDFKMPLIVTEKGTVLTSA